MRYAARFLATLFCSLLIFTTCFAPVARGEEDPSVAVVSISSYDQLMQHASVVGEIVGFPNAQQMMELQLMQLTGGKPLAGLDKTKPIVIDVKLGKAQPYAIACLPVTDLKALLDSLPPQLSDNEDVGDGVLLMKAAEGPLYAKQGQGWTYFADQKEHLAKAPEDPPALAGDLPELYVFATRVNVQNVPADKRAELIGFLELMNQLQLAGVAEAGGDIETQQELMKQNIAQLSKLINETEDVVIGLGIDRDNKNVHVDFSTTAQADSDTATSYKRFQAGKSSHAGFLHADATIAMAAHLSGKPPANEIEVMDEQQKMFQGEMMQEIDDDDELSSEQKETVKEAMAKILNALFDTARSDSLQLGFAAMLNKNSTLVGGMNISDGDTVEGAIKQLVGVISSMVEIPGPDWEAENHGFYRIHTWKNIPITEEDEAAAITKMIGDQLEFAVAVNAESIYMSMGGNAVEDLKKVIDASAKASNEVSKPLEAVVNMGPIMKFAAEADPQSGAMLLPVVGMLEEKDAIVYDIDQIPNGIRGRITVQQNVLRSLPLMSMMMGAAGGGAPNLQ
ncbi:MAG: hypothetical protein VX431_02485 [Planctomycetota bacterium]|nr:hypothetical protein [Planctomycetota bacterium]